MRSLAARLAGVRERIAAAEHRAGAAAGSVQLVAVTKYSTLERVQELHDLGLRHLGESRALQLAERAEALSSDLSWHMIGHLQTNKIKKLLPYVHLIHSVDSLDLANAISMQAVGLHRQIHVLLEVKTSAEATKTGVSLQQAADAYAEIAACPGLHLRGLMTMAPHTSDETSVRRSFHDLRHLFDSLASVPCAPAILSMGMSDDFEWAIEEGANMVRIGHALVGD